MTTKEKILNSSLNLFSTKGYKAVSVRDIASDVGIKASSLYNHFESKQDILDELIKLNINYVRDFLKEINLKKMIESETCSNTESFENNFIDVSLKIIRFFLENINVIKFRKMLTIEQFNRPELAALYRKIFVSDILEYESNLFDYLMKKNILIKNDPYILALQFYSPIFLLLYNEEQINKEDYATIKKHIFQFKDTYSMKG